MNHLKWSKIEKKIAREAFDKAYELECSYVAGRILERANQIKKPDDIWRLHDFLTEKRKEVDEKYDIREALRKGDLDAASRLARLYTLTPVAV